MRSSTGSAGYHASSVRTSDNAWVQHTPTAERLKRRTFELLGFTRYDENCADGLQVLRYNATQAYIEHVDYLDAPRNVDAAALDPSKPGGANRFATVFFYLSDVAKGGETHFPKARVEYGDTTANDTDPGSGDDDDVDDAAFFGGVFDALGENAWQRRLAAGCRVGRRNRARSIDRSRLVAGGSAAESVRARRGGVALAPVKDGALVYYSQTPDGALDPASKHGGCPVIDGLKWAANLWVWNAPIPFTSSRLGPAGAASATPRGATPPAATAATFANVDVELDHAESEEIALFYEPDDGSAPQRMGELKCCGVTPLGLSSFVGHTFTARQAPRNHGGDAAELARASHVLRRWVVVSPTPPLGGTADTTTTGGKDEPNAFRLRLIDLDLA